MPAPPKWAQDYLLDALCWWTDQTMSECALPSLSWRRCNRKLSSGAFNLGFNQIRMNAGRDLLDAKVVLLHELAHSIVPGEGHTPRFWETAWRLFRWAKLPIGYVRQQEGNYKNGALVAYRRSVTITANN